MKSLYLDIMTSMKLHLLCYFIVQSNVSTDIHIITITMRGFKSFFQHHRICVMHDKLCSTLLDMCSVIRGVQIHLLT